jgi:hypothetical protein
LTKDGGEAEVCGDEVESICTVRYDVVMGVVGSIVAVFVGRGVG